MSKMSFDVHARRVFLGVTAICLCLLAGSVFAQEDRDSDSSVLAILQRFGDSWNDKNWRPNYMRPMDDAGWKRRMGALQSIVRQGRGGVVDLVKALASDSVAVRALAAQALGYCADASAKQALAATIEQDPDPMVRLYAVDSLGMLGGDDFDGLLRRVALGEKNRDTKRHIRYALDREGQSVNSGVVQRLIDWQVENLRSARLGQPAPDFELESLDGSQVKLSDYRGKKVVVLVFVYGDT